MEGKHPKRRKDKYNPYSICERNGSCYIEFLDGEHKKQAFEISRELYEAFDEFELRDISYLHQWDKYIEHSEIWEHALNGRAIQKPESVEDVVLEKLLVERLHRAIQKLPEIQKRRLILYFYDGMTYERIAKLEGCTKMPVKRSIDVALEKLKKELEK
jgi:RNA polymerase sigma factor (sigma-70 family)